MNVQPGLSLPQPRPKRRRIFTIRLTDDERAEIETLAKRLQLSDSVVARHFILEGVTQYRQPAEVSHEA